ncbi:MAG: hypothetical protein AMS21_01195 [Gemmatimonas sp. SG8_38_2]|nr:MAG: hypothetical protein AMS21_01195 [Gemmatimonas sp. SG8_38_2]
MIYEPRSKYYLDVVWDRQGGACVDEADRPELNKLLEWVSENGIQLLRDEARKVKLHESSGELITIKRDGYVLMASPKKSYGYMYCGAWKELK